MMEDFNLFGEQDQPLEIMITGLFIIFVVKSFWAFLERKTKLQHIQEMEKIKRTPLIREDSFEKIFETLAEIDLKLKRIEKAVDDLVVHADSKTKQ